MKKIIASVTIISLLAPQLLSAKNSDLVKVEYVQAQQTNKKGVPIFIAFVRIGFRLYRVASRINNVAKLIKRVQHYVDKYGLNRNKIAQHFAEDMSIVLIDSFYSPKNSYRPFEKITFKAKLKQKAYTYIVSLSNDGACLLFPNGTDKKNLYQPNQYYTFANKDYKIYSNKRGVESFYFITSTTPLLSQFQSTFNIQTSTYSCGTRKNGKNKLNALKQKSNVEIRAIDIPIQ